MAIALTDNMLNVRYFPEIIGSYGLLRATYVFEHVPDPTSYCPSSARWRLLSNSKLLLSCDSVPSSAAVSFVNWLGSSHARNGVEAYGKGSVRDVLMCI